MWKANRCWSKLSWVHAIVSYNGEKEYGKNKTSNFLRDAQETVTAIKLDGGKNLRVICLEKEIQVLWMEGVNQGYGDCKALNLIQRLHPSYRKFKKNAQVWNNEE